MASTRHSSVHDGKHGSVPVVCTIFCKNYLAQTRNFHETFRRFNSTIPFVALLVDRPDGLFIPSQEPFEILGLTDLGARNLQSLLFKNDLQGVCCSLKPFLLRYLLKRGFGPAIFMDPDILVLHDLSPAIADMRSAAIALTPNYLSPPQADDRIKKEISMLRGGTFNGGFLGVSQRPEAFEFLDWWADRLRALCRHDPSAGMHYDQRWLDLAPSLFGGVKVLRDPGLNVAYWNFAERSLQIDDAGAHVGAEPCRFFHFSGYNPSEPERLTRFDEMPLPAVSRSSVAPIFARYRDALLRHGWADTNGWAYSYACFSNGVAIIPLVREIYAARCEETVFEDPFEANSPDSFYRYLCSCPDGRVTPRLWREIYDRRPDLQVQFRDIEGADQESFGAWVAERASLEFGLPNRIPKDCAT